MYNEYFGFKEAPFSIAPDPRYLYMTAQHRDALAHLVYGLNSEGGCILLTGEVGTGKTTICRCLLEQIPDQANVALVLNPKVSEIELLETICDELKIDYPESVNTVKTYTDRIYNFLIKTNKDNEKTVLIIDEAQNLSSKVLEQLRLLTNLETNQRKLLQIIILGQPELLDILARSEMRQLAQRITARFHLQPLNKSEVKAYVSHRLAVAGQNIQLFPENSIKLLYKLSNGIPRLINVICDRSLLGAYVENQHSVSPSILRKATKEVFGELKNVEKKSEFKKIFLPLSAVAISIISITALIYFTGFSFNNLSLNGKAETSASNDTSTPEALTKEIAVQPETNELVAKKIDLTEKDRKITTAITQDKIESPEKTDRDSQIDSQNISSAPTIETATTEPVTIEPITNEPTQTNTEPAVTVQFDNIQDILNNPQSNRVSAYQQLFIEWEQEYNAKSGTTACAQASTYSLSCLHKKGNLNSLKVHDRPAVLKLITSNGVDRYVTITSLVDDVATIFANNTEYKIELGTLNKYWYGQFILLWKKPENYSAAITPGDNGNIVSWLQSQFINTESYSTTSTDNSLYDEKLKSKVKEFQAQHGLSADGIVGPVTIIHLNAESGTNVPRLSQQS